MPCSVCGFNEGVFKKYVDKFVIVIIDDILVCSRTIKEHKLHSKTILEEIERNKVVCEAHKMQV